MVQKYQFSWYKNIYIWIFHFPIVQPFMKFKTYREVREPKNSSFRFDLLWSIDYPSTHCHPHHGSRRSQDQADRSQVYRRQGPSQVPCHQGCSQVCSAERRCQEAPSFSSWDCSDPVCICMCMYALVALLCLSYLDMICICMYVCVYVCRQIRKYQKSTELLLRKMSFERLVREVLIVCVTIQSNLVSWLRVYAYTHIDTHIQICHPTINTYTHTMPTITCVYFYTRRSRRISKLICASNLKLF